MQPSRPAPPAPAQKLPTAPHSSFLTREPTLPPVLRSNRIVFWSAISCLGALALFLLAVRRDSLAYPILHRLSASLLLAALQYGLIAWHTRAAPKSFGLGLATSCRLWVSAVGFVAVP